MLLLTSVSDIIRIVTVAAVTTIGVHASWVDNAAGTITPGRTNTNITTATTTTIVTSPAASTQRNVKGLVIENNSAATSTQVTIQHFDGTTSCDLFSVTLLAAENLNMDETGAWHHRDAQGAEYTYATPANQNLGVTGTLAETMPRETCPEVNTAVPTASGTLFMQAIYLKAGQLVSNIAVSSATTAAVTPTGGRVGLYDGSRNLRATSADQATTAWAANTLKTLAMTTPYRVPTSGLYYIGFYMAATTVITTKGGTAKTGGQLASSVPILHGTSSTGLATTLPDPAAAITGGLVTIYAAVT
jgi:hypothetical protein